MQQKAFAFQGVISKDEVNLMRAYTLKALCFYLGCNEAYFRQFKSNIKEDEQGFSTVISDIENIIFIQKFEGAAAGLLSTNIIARDLGLVDKKDHSNNGGKFETAPPVIISMHSDAKGNE